MDKDIFIVDDAPIYEGFYKAMIEHYDKMAKEAKVAIIGLNGARIGVFDLKLSKLEGRCMSKAFVDEYGKSCQGNTINHQPTNPNFCKEDWRRK